MAAPEGDAVEFQLEAVGAEVGDEEFVVAEAFAGAGGEGVGAGEAGGLESGGCSWVLLGGYEQPLVGFGDAAVDGAVDGLELVAGLAGLVGSEVEGVDVGDDGLPGEVAADGVLEFA